MSLLKGNRFIHENIKWILLLFFLMATGTICAMNVMFESETTYLSFFDSLYFVVKLFFAGANKMPASGAWYFLYPLMAIYFLAPVFTVSQILSFFQSLIYSNERGLKRLSNHIIMAGLGKSGYHIFQMLKKEYGHWVLPVDKDDSATAINELESTHSRFVIGDITNRQILEKARIGKCRLFISFTGNDVVNLDAAMLASEMTNSKCKCIIQVNDIFLINEIKIQLLNDKYKNITVINNYEALANRVITEMAGKIKGDNNIFVIAGFGRFGQMLALKISSSAYFENNSYNKMAIVDQNHDSFTKWKLLSKLYSEQIRFRTHILGKQDFFINNIINPDVWEEIRKVFPDHKYVIIIATDNDINNFNASLVIKRFMREKHLEGNTYIISRFFKGINSIRQEDIFPLIYSDIIENELNREMKNTD
jgi:voltage-gated potassium channel Kch